MSSWNSACDMLKSITLNKATEAERVREHAQKTGLAIRSKRGRPGSSRLEVPPMKTGLEAERVRTYAQKTGLSARPKRGKPGSSRLDVPMKTGLAAREGGGQRFQSHAPGAREGSVAGHGEGVSQIVSQTPVSKEEMKHSARRPKVGRYAIKSGQGYMALARKLGYKNYKELRTAMRSDGVKMLHAGKDYSKYKKGGQWYAGKMGTAVAEAAGGPGGKVGSGSVASTAGDLPITGKPARAITGTERPPDQK